LLGNSISTIGANGDAAIRLSALACGSTVRMEMKTNRTNASTTVNALAAVTDTNITVFDQDTGGLTPQSVVIPYIGAATGYFLNLKRSSGSTSFPDIWADGTNALILGGKSDGSGGYQNRGHYRCPIQRQDGI
jgi:hypothetical protein